MCVKIQLIKSKINVLNAQIAQFHDSQLFSPTEIAELTAPLVPKVMELQEEKVKLQAREYEVVDAEALTPLKQYN